MGSPGGRLLDMAATLVLHGALMKSFLCSRAAAVKCFHFAKIHPFLKEFREKNQQSDAFAHIEKVATRSKTARKRLERVLKNIENRRKALAKTAKKS